jgi:hypothetical protein
MNYDTDDREYRITPNADWQRFAYTLQCYGRGTSSIGEGVPHGYNDHAEAEKRGRTWVATGVAPADQRD